MPEQLQEHPVVVIMIVGTRVTVDGKNVGHDGSLPLSWVAIDAVVARVAAPLGRPVHAVATDAAGTSTLVIHLDGALSNVQQVSEQQSEHFPAPKGAESAVPLAPALARVTPWPRLRLLGGAAVTTLLVGLIGATAMNSASTPAAQSVDVTSAGPAASASPTQAPSPVSSQRAPVSPEPISPVIKATARHRAGEPVQLTIRSSIAPLKVRVMLLPVGASTQEAVVRRIQLREVGSAGRTLVVFGDVSPQLYRWQITAVGAEAKTGTIRVRAAAPVVTPDAEQPQVLPRSAPAPEPTTPQPKPPSPGGPRENTPIPPVPQP